MRRLSIHQGRVLVTTTPYDLGWLKQKLYDPWRQGRKDIDVISFASIMNPTFPHEEFERARRDLPPWKFSLFYLAKFTRPAGLIYDCFNLERDTCKRFTIPDSWRRFIGLDFGGVNTAALFYAEEPFTKTLYLYREYKAGDRTAKEHVEVMLKGEPYPYQVVGGSKSEGQWRKEFRQGGLKIREPDQPDVEVGITRVYGANKRHEIVVFDDLAGYLDQKQSYSRPVDANGDPMEGIEDKEIYHFMDAERYIISYLNRPNAADNSNNDGDNPLY